MIFNKHSELDGKHAFLGASKYQWLTYDDETLVERFVSSYSQTIGTVLHEIAAMLIDKNLKLNKTDRKLVYFELLRSGIPEYVIDMDIIYPNLMTYVNDAIMFRMTVEQKLVYSRNCFGTADAISFRNNTLRIHDLKTGSTPAHMEQLAIYAALFCLEYKYKPTEISFELRIYQSDEVIVDKPAPEMIQEIIDRIVAANHIVNTIRGQEE